MYICTSQEKLEREEDRKGREIKDAYENWMEKKALLSFKYLSF